MFIAIRPTALLLGAAALLAAGVPASARASDVSWSISVGTPAPVYAPPPVVYVQPQPVYVQPEPVYVAPRRVYVQPAPVYVQPGTVVHVATPPFGYGPPRHARGKHRHHGHRRHHDH